MRLNPFNTNNINVRSSGGGVPGGKAGGIGCGTIVIAAIGYFVFGLDPMQTAGMVEGVQQGQQQAGPANTDEQEVCTSSEYALEACNGLQSLNQTWATTFDAQGYGDQFQQPWRTLIMQRTDAELFHQCNHITYRIVQQNTHCFPPLKQFTGEFCGPAPPEKAVFKGHFVDAEKPLEH